MNFDALMDDVRESNLTEEHKSFLLLLLEDEKQTELECIQIMNGTRNYD